MATENRVKARSDQAAKDFQNLNSWEDRYKKIISMGKSLPDLPDTLRTEESKVKGCQSQVWLHAKLNSQGDIEFQGDSDALLVKGLVALLLQIYSGVTPEEILSTPPDFLKAIGFEGNLSPSRANGLFAMIKQIRYFATAFAMLKKQNQA
ncbi:MAG: Fe-S metabolism protein SufE [Bdellovibrio sp. CG10_big_fil_rev_8_21_14_0_10_47_8]|nr:MAG: Fe-S metabolism protein SufE [Bdellovibrio sp. CG10_big_fil_rev_8_21_14_0_10_47_8]